MEAMEWQDWIALGQLVAFVAVGIYFARRLERLRQLYAKNLKRYDLLHTARFTALEDVDNRLVEVQKAEFEIWKHLQFNHAFFQETGDRMVDLLDGAVTAASLAVIKCEKYFKEDINQELRDLMEKVQRTEQCVNDYWLKQKYPNGGRTLDELRASLNEAYKVSKAAIPAFRSRMGEIIQKDVG